MWKVINHQNIELRPADPNYAETIFSWRQQPSTVKHNPLMKLSLEEVRSDLENTSVDLSSLKAGQDYRWFAFLNDSLIGNFSLKNVNLMMMYAEIGYGVGEEYQGQGLGKVIVKLLLTKVFAETELRKLIAYVHDKNIPSCRLLESLGFQKEGFLRDHYIINGKPENEILYGLLKSDFVTE